MASASLALTSAASPAAAGAGMSRRTFGVDVRRVEDPALLRGQARFVDDIRLPGMLHVAFVRSPHAHAAILRIDRSAALALPGVHAVLTVDDLAARLNTT